MSKRRRWLHKMVASGAAEQPLFYFKNPDVSHCSKLDELVADLRFMFVWQKKDEMVVECPRSFLAFEGYLQLCL